MIKFNNDSNSITKNNNQNTQIDKKKVLNMVNDFGIKNNIIVSIKNILSDYPVEKAYLYGSRARGDYNNTSDIDIAVKGKTIDSTKVNLIINDLELLDTALTFDVVNFNDLGKKELKDNISKEGVKIYDNSK